VLKHYSAAQFLDDFVPAEVVDVQSKSATIEDILAWRRAYLETLLDLLQTLPQRGELDRLADFQAALNQLLVVTWQRDAAQRPSPAQGSPQQELAAHYLIDEPTFQSAVPLIGPLIAAFRRAWNNVSTRWYVRPMMDQQQRFNVLVSQLLAEQARLLEDRSSEAQANAQAISQLANQLLAQQQQIQHLTQTISHLQQTIEESNQ
jgi:hypothetical protein